jgi:hypothetical protein
MPSELSKPTVSLKIPTLQVMSIKCLRQGVAFLLRIKEVPGSNISQILSPATETIPVFPYIPHANYATGTPNVIAYNYLVTRYKEILVPWTNLYM